MSQPFTPAQLAAVERGRLSGLERRLIATIRQLQEQKQTRDHTEELDRIADERNRLREELARIQERTTYRVLIVATKDESLEIYTDPGVKVAVACVPQSNREHEADAEDWALRQVPSAFRSMPDEELRSERYSCHCLSKGEFMWLLTRLKEQEYLNELGRAVGELVNQESRKE
jgi:hypothetical protein